MKLEIINREIFDEFVSGCDANNFYQSIYMYDRLSVNNECYLLGGYKEDKLFGVCFLVLRSTFLGKKYFETYKGFITDFSNHEDIKLFSEGLIEFVKECGGYKLGIDPYIARVSRDCNGNVTDEFDNSKLDDVFKSSGFKYIGVNEQVKWTYCLDTLKSSDLLFKEFSSNTRNTINRINNKYKLVIEELDYNDLDRFKRITDMTSKRRGFVDCGMKYYQSMGKCFKEKVKFKVVSLNCDLYIDSLNSDILNIKSSLSKLSASNSNKNKIDNLNIDLVNCESKLEEVNKLKEEYGNIIDLSAAMFMLYGDEVIYLFSGSDDRFMSFKGQYALQWDMIKYASLNNYRRYNFYGISGNFDPESKDYGVYSFKKSFGGYVEELLGNYEIGFGIVYKVRSIIDKFRGVK